MSSIVEQIQSRHAPIGIVGLGYVGLPLACLFATKFRVVGFDTDQTRISELARGIDRTREIDSKSRLVNELLEFHTDRAALANCPIIIVTVPTPVDRFNNPDLESVKAASQTVGSVMKAGTIIVYESTVYPGVTEDICRRELEKASGLTYGQEFFLGYSPERVNPGDDAHTIDRIVKVVSGSTAEVADVLEAIYGSVITAGIFRAASIPTAEAAKVIENTQRDINIALVNELAIIFERFGLDTMDVLEAAGTKWNFAKFTPGLVGGHCIGVDPFYLTHLAEGLGIHPIVISSGRRLNDGMAQFVAQKTLSMVLNANPEGKGKLKVLLMGITFKENISDFRNSKSIEIVRILESCGVEVYVFDPEVDKEAIYQEFGQRVVEWEEIPVCDGIILSVPHQIFVKEFPIHRLLEKLSAGKVILDIKSVLDRETAQSHGVNLWRL